LQKSIHSDTMKALNTLLRSSDFDVWLSRVADQKAKARILARLASATFGNFGDCEPVGEGVSEMRVHVGAGYRVYYTRTGSTVLVLPTMFCWLAAQRPPKRKTLLKRRKWLARLKGRNNEEKENNLQTI
jgi:putative addiction module killer protein